MSDNSRTNTNNTIYREYCNGMKNQSREHIRLAGEIARRLTKTTFPSKPSDNLNVAITNFCQLEVHFENIENNLNKVCALTRHQR